MPVPILVNGARGLPGTPPTARKGPVACGTLGIGRMGDQANATVDCPLLGERFTDCVSLLREGGQWRIVNNMYAPQAQQVNAGKAFLGRVRVFGASKRLKHCWESLGAGRAMAHHGLFWITSSKETTHALCSHSRD